MYAFTALHELGCHCDIPRPLGFIEDDDVVTGCSKVANSRVTEMVHVLDKSLDRLLDFPFSLCFSLGAQAREFVARQCLAEHGDQRAVAREKNGMRLGSFVATLGGDIQAHQGLAGARNPSDKDNCMFSLVFGSIDYGFDIPGGGGEVLRAGIVPGDGCDLVLAV